MKPTNHQYGMAGRKPRGGFTIMELMLAISITGVIVFALYGMFNHTQKALRANIAQVDVLESGRVTMDLLGREFSEMSATDFEGGTNFLAFPTPVYDPMVQALVGVAAYRTNFLYDCYLFSRQNRDAIGTSYRILFAENGVGTLCRYSTNIPLISLTRTNLIRLVTTQAPTNYAKMAEGVIHFRLRAYNADGRLLSYDTTNGWNTYRLHRETESGQMLQTTVSSNLVMQGSKLRETRLTFLSNALPAYVEVELGVLEPKLVEQLKSFEAGSDLAKSFVSRYSGQVHLFRQRVPIRQSDLSSTAFR